jgi:hypothetical protein
VSREADPAGVAPPPGPALLAAIEGMKPVPTRVPGRALAALLALGAAWAIGAVGLHGVRDDLPELPLLWVVGTALAWAAALTAVVVAVALPPKGEVLPDTARAGRVAVMATAGLLVLGLCVTADAPGETIMPKETFAGFGRAWWHCARFSLESLIPVLALGALMFRRAFPIGSYKVAAALGAAGGAAGGLALHFICPVGGGLHVGLAHAGGVAIGAIAGMLILGRWLRG